MQEGSAKIDRWVAVCGQIHLHAHLWGSGCAISMISLIWWAVLLASSYRIQLATIISSVRNAQTGGTFRTHRILKIYAASARLVRHASMERRRSSEWPR